MTDIPRDGGTGPKSQKAVITLDNGWCISQSVLVTLNEGYDNSARIS